MIYLVHHGEALPADVDAQRPLAAAGRAAVERLALEATRRGATPVAIWHSGKLRARQTGEVLRSACNPRSAFTMVRGLRPADPSDILADRLAGETRDVLLVGHMPLIARLLRRLVGQVGEDLAFPRHGIVALEPDPGGDVTRWCESWRLGPDD
ncbi:MAG: phosphohistidine phosphatase SixA [Acidobacteria bacterium]|nr:phosphohistidine phosphatase SixA [Acidobacteriota bacterium]